MVEGVARCLESVTARRIVRYLASGTVIVLLGGYVKLAPGLVRQVSGTKFVNIGWQQVTSLIFPLIIYLKHERKLRVAKNLLLLQLELIYPLKKKE